MLWFIVFIKYIIPQKGCFRYGFGLFPYKKPRTFYPRFLWGFLNSHFFGYCCLKIFFRHTYRHQLYIFRTIYSYFLIFINRQKSSINGLVVRFIKIPGSTRQFTVPFILIIVNCFFIFKIIGLFSEFLGFIFGTISHLTYFWHTMTYFK